MKRLAQIERQLKGEVGLFFRAFVWGIAAGIFIFGFTLGVISAIWFAGTIWG